MQKQKVTKQQEVRTALGTRYACHFEREAEGGYTVTCPALPAVGTYGGTMEDARANAREAIEEWNEEAERLRAHYRAICYDQDLWP